MAENCRVLVVDDSPMVYKAVKRALEPEGFEMLEQAFNGQEGVEKVKQLQPDVIIMDITMPIMDGIQAAELICRKNAATKIIMMSAMGDQELMSKAKRIGVSKFLNKPFNPEELVSTVRSLL